MVPLIWYISRYHKTAWYSPQLWQISCRPVCIDVIHFYYHFAPVYVCRLMPMAQWEMPTSGGENTLCWECDHCPGSKLSNVFSLSAMQPWIWNLIFKPIYMEQPIIFVTHHVMIVRLYKRTILRAFLQLADGRILPVMLWKWGIVRTAH